MRATPALFALCAALPAAAGDCPVAGDLAGGIRLSDGAEVSETFRLESPGLVSSVYAEAGVATRALLLRGLYMVEIVELDDAGAPVAASRITFSFPDPPGGIRDPRPGEGWAGTMTTLDGGDILAEPVVVRFGAAASIAFGDCRYDSLPVSITYPDRDPAYFEELTWLGALGFSFLSANTGADGSAVRFRYDQIESLP